PKNELTPLFATGFPPRVRCRTVTATQCPSKCARKERSRPAGVFGGWRYSSDCIALQEHSRPRNRFASVPEPGTCRPRVFGTTRLLPCRCRRRADCNGTEYPPLRRRHRRPPPAIAPLHPAVAERSARHPPGLLAERRRQGARAPSSPCHERESTRWLRWGRMCAALP